MLKRTVTGVFLVAFVVGFFFLRSINHNLFLILIGLISLIGNIEMSKMLGEKTCTAQKAVCILFAPASVVAFYFFGASGTLICFTILALANFFIPVFKRGSVGIESMGLGFISLIYPSLILLPLMMINALNGVSFFALILVFVISCSADVFAYLVGMTFKGPKLIPEISPKKTVSGAIGGLLGGMVGSIVTYALLKNTFVYHLNVSPYLYFAIVGLIGAFLTEIGDLVESFLKRQLGVKDSGKIFPGHGGMLDRIDGILFCSVFVWMIVALF